MRVGGTEQIHSSSHQHNVASGTTPLDRGWTYSALELPVLRAVEQVWAYFWDPRLGACVLEHSPVDERIESL